MYQIFIMSDSSLYFLMLNKSEKGSSKVSTYVDEGEKVYQPIVLNLATFY